MRYVLLLFILISCTSTRTVMVIDSLGNDYYHVVGMKDNYSDVIRLPNGTQEGDLVKIKLKKEK